MGRWTLFASCSFQAQAEPLDPWRPLKDVQYGRTLATDCHWRWKRWEDSKQPNLLLPGWENVSRDNWKCAFWSVPSIIVLWVCFFFPSSVSVRALQQMQDKIKGTIDPVLSPHILKRSHGNMHVYHNCASAMGPLVFYAASVTSAITILICGAGLQNASHGPELSLVQEGTDSITFYSGDPRSSLNCYLSTYRIRILFLKSRFRVSIHVFLGILFSLSSCYMLNPVLIFIAS